MEPMNPFQSGSNADSPGLLPMTELPNWDFSNIDLAQGLLQSPTCLPGTPNAGPQNLISGDPSTPQSVPQAMPLHDTVLQGHDMKASLLSFYW
jgi:hypothetical protein